MTDTIQRPFSAEQQQWYEQACARLNPERLKQLLFAITDIHSPTGAARAASEFMAGHLSEAGLKARYQPMTDTSGNVLAEYRGSGGGAALMLYAP
ncbi:MAG: acetylornithine deacetylase, partial [Parazoarcus communis]